MIYLEVSVISTRCLGGEIGRRTGLKILGFRKGRTGSIPVRGTKYTLPLDVKTKSPCDIQESRFLPKSREPIQKHFKKLRLVV